MEAPKGGGRFCQTCGSEYQMMELPKGLIKICPGCNTQAPKGCGQFCGNCGTAYQMMEPPSFENGGICPHCQTQVPVGSGDYCTHCGRAFFGGTSIKMPTNINLQAAGDFVGGLGGKLGMSMQRMVLAAASVLGILFGLVPRYSITSTAKAMIAYSGGGFPNAAYTLFGWIATIVFAVVIGLCFIGNRAATIGKLKKAVIACGAVNLLLGILQFVAFNAGDYKQMSSMNMGGIGFGLYLLVLMSAVVCAIPFIKRLEQR